MNRALPKDIQLLIDCRLPDLSIHFVDPNGWEWTFRCNESDLYFDSWEEALLDFTAETSNLLDEARGVNQE